MNDIALLGSVLPSTLLRAITISGKDIANVREIALDLSRNVRIFWRDNTVTDTSITVTEEMLAEVSSKLGDFGEDNRAALAACLHRFSKIVNRRGKMIGLTIRVGKDIPGAGEIVEDLAIEAGSMLLIGRPGRGKTSMLRSIAATLAAYGQRVVVVDTSNEIAGDGDVPHPAIGDARRLMVPFRKSQAEVMIEAVENHTPDVVMVDEISAGDEAYAAATIARRGVKLIATAHGNTIEDVLRNPPLLRLLGGVKEATLSDTEASRRGSQKVVQEQAGPATFSTVVELTSFTTVTIYRDIDKVIGAILGGAVYSGEQRSIAPDGSIRVLSKQHTGSVEMRDIEQSFLQKGPP